MTDLGPYREPMPQESPLVTSIKAELEQAKLTKEEIGNRKYGALISKCLARLPNNIRENLPFGREIHLDYKSKWFGVIRKLEVKGTSDPLYLFAEKEILKMGFTCDTRWGGPLRDHFIKVEFSP